MFIIPSTKPHITTPVVHLDNNTVQPSTILKPKLYIVQEYPLPILSYFIYELFNPFSRINYKVTSIKNLSTNTLLTKADGLGSISDNSYLVRFTDYILVVGLDTNIQFKITVFTTFPQAETDINQHGFSLESVNIKGHIASYTQDGNTVTLSESFLYPLPVALNYSLTVNTLDLQQSRDIYRVQTSIGYKPDYVLYNNKYYCRSRYEIPKPNEFTYTPTGVLLWT